MVRKKNTSRISIMVVLLHIHRTRICTEGNETHTKNTWTQVDNQETIKLGNKVKTHTKWLEENATNAGDAVPSMEKFYIFLVLNRFKSFCENGSVHANDTNSKQYELFSEVVLGQENM